MAKKSNAASCGPCGMGETAEDKKRRRQWELEDAARTLTRAAEIRKDKKLMGELRAWAAEQAKTMRTAIG